MLTGKNTCEVTIHFNREQHVLSNFNFIIIEEICNASDNKLEQRLTRREETGPRNSALYSPTGLIKDANLFRRLKTVF